MCLSVGELSDSPGRPREGSGRGDTAKIESGFWEVVSGQRTKGWGHAHGPAHGTSPYTSRNRQHFLPLWEPLWVGPSGGYIRVTPISPTNPSIHLAGGSSVLCPLPSKACLCPWLGDVLMCTSIPLKPHSSLPPS